MDVKNLASEEPGYPVRKISEGIEDYPSCHMSLLVTDIHLEKDRENVAYRN